MSQSQKDFISNDIIFEIIKLFTESDKPIIKHIAIKVGITVWKVDRILREKGLLGEQY